MALNERMIRTKEAWAREKRGADGPKGKRPSDDRLPPGQHLRATWPVLDLGQKPEVAPADWRLTVKGFVANPVTWTWEDFLTPLVYLNEPKLYTISVALRSFADPSAATDWGAIFAMSALSLVPVFVVFIVFQRYLVEGISTTGMKG